MTAEESEKARMSVFLLVVVVVDDNLCLFLSAAPCLLFFIIAMYLTMVKSKILEIQKKVNDCPEKELCLALCH